MIKIIPFLCLCSCVGPRLFLSNKTQIFSIDYTNTINFEQMDYIILDMCQELDTCQFNHLLTIQYGYNSPCYSESCYWCGNNAIYIEPIKEHNEYYLAHELAHFYSEQMGFTCDGYHDNFIYYRHVSW